MVAEPTSRPSTRRRASRRDAIHRVAIDQFAERGFAGTSMANIAEAAGMSRPALYQYFRDKDDIFQSAFVVLLRRNELSRLVRGVAPSESRRGSG